MTIRSTEFKTLCMFKSKISLAVSVMCLTAVITVVNPGCNSRLPDDVLGKLSVEESQRILPGTTIAAAASRTLSGDFVFENKSDTPILIQLAGRNCSCVKVELKDKVILVHDEFTVAPHSNREVKVSRSLLPGGTTKAEILTIARPVGADVSRQLVCSIQQALYPDVFITPSLIRTELTDQSETQTINVTLSAVGTDVDSLEKSRLVTTSKCLGVSVAVEPGRNFERDGLYFREWNTAVTASSQPNIATARQLIGAIEFQLIDSEGNSEPAFAASLPVTITNDFGLESPAVVSLGAIKSGESKRTQFRIISNSERPFEILSAHSTNENFHVICEYAKSGRSHWLTVSFASELRGEHHGVVELHTTCKEMPRIRVKTVAVGI